MELPKGGVQEVGGNEGRRRNSGRLLFRVELHRFITGEQTAVDRDEYRELLQSSLG